MNPPAPNINPKPINQYSKEPNIGTQPVSIVTHEFPQTWDKDREPFYPVNDEKNNTLYRQYHALAQRECPHITFGGRLGLYRYFNMDETIKNALEQWEVLKTKLLLA